MGPILAKTQGERECTPYAGVDGDSRIFGSAGCAARLGIRKETETENAAMPRIPPMFLMVFGLAAQAFLPAAPPGPRWWQWTLALPLALASLAFLFGSSMRFYRAGVSADPVDVDRPRALVRDGVYRVTRNPMYVAMAGILAAHAVLRGPWAWLPAACFALIIDRLQIPAEEEALRRTFPEEYAEYSSKVPRWLGWLRA